ncbi:MAG: hypothetical protein ACJ8GN_17460 [Longimicrobiaceae bacterium]
MRIDVPSTPTTPGAMSPEQKAALEAAGVTFGTGEPLRDFRPLRKRPRWFAFLLTLLFGPG